MLASKLCGARQRIKQHEGPCEGPNPYGHREGEAQIIARMRALRNEGLSYERIAAELNADNVPPRKGAFWSG